MGKIMGLGLGIGGMSIGHLIYIYLLNWEDTMPEFLVWFMLVVGGGLGLLFGDSLDRKIKELIRSKKNKQASAKNDHS